jgi:hypothetical protein
MVSLEISKEQVMADPGNHGRDPALHAWHVANRHPKTDKPSRVVDVDVLQERSGTWKFFEVFLSGPEIGMRPKPSIVLPLRGHKAVAPQQDLIRETGQRCSGSSGTASR